MPVLTTSLNSSLGPAVCRVCLCGEASIPYLGKAPGEPLISPCHCKGTMGLYHRSCLEHWLSVSRTYCCEICKFRYEIGRRKQSFWTYLRTHWFADDQSHSIGGDCTCLLIISPLTLGGAVLCIQSAAEKLQHVNENGDFEKAHEILALGLMALFLIIVFGFWVVFTVLFYLNDFRIWQKKNVILYVIDQLDREGETYSQSHNQLSESLRPLLIKKKLRKFLCCGMGSLQKEDTVIPLHEGIFDINPQMVETSGQATPGAEHVGAIRSVIISPVSHTSHASGSPSQETNVSTSILAGTPNHTFDEVPALSTFRPHYTVASAQVLVSTPNKNSPLPMFQQLNDQGIGSPGAAVYSPSSMGDGSGHVCIGAVDETGSTSAGTSPRVETPL